MGRSDGSIGIFSIPLEAQVGKGIQAPLPHALVAANENTAELNRLILHYNALPINGLVSADYIRFRALWRGYTDKTVVHIDGGYTGTEMGTFNKPYDSVTEGYYAATDNGILRIKEGLYSENITLYRPLRLQTQGQGIVRIGN